tara:strand:+ start:91 stop:357 length:267 start_codon:yes stop_codon:yes gene_type:complete
MESKMNIKEKVELEKNALINIQDEINSIISADMKARISSDEQWEIKKMLEIKEIMEQIESVQGPLHDQEALYERAWEEWDRLNEVEEG